MRRLAESLLLATGILLCGCASQPLITPENDLVREHQDEMALLRAEAVAFCLDGRGGVDTSQIRLKKTAQGVRAGMEAACKEGMVKIRCELVEKGSHPVCESLPN